MQRLLPAGLLLVSVVATFVAHQVALGPLPVLERGLRDSLHAPGFAVLASIVLLCLRTWGIKRFATLTAAVLCVGVAVIAEGAQVFGPRDADLGDLGVDLIGIAFGLLTTSIAVGDFGPDSRLRPHKNLGIVCSAMLGVFALWPTADAAFAIVAQRQSLPTLADFESRWERQLYEKSVRNGMTIVRAPSPELFQGGRTALLDLSRPSIPGLEFFPFPDWSSYSSISFDVQSASDKPIQVTLRIHDTSHNNEWNDRFGFVFEAGREARTIRLPLSEVQQTPSGRRLDLESVEGVIFFTSQPTGDERIYVDNIRLD